jgi:hypothetical protein
VHLKATLARSARSADRGQVLPLVALSLVALAGVGALAVDAGYLRYQQRAQQIAADSAAIAGANEITWLSRARVQSGAQLDATINGYTDGDSGTTVTVNNPPQSGPYAGNNRAVEVVITRRQPAFFAAIFGTSSFSVSTRAVAAANPTELACVYALKGDITLNGGGQGGVNAPTCGILTNYNLNVTGQANVDALFIGYIGTGPSGGTYPESQPTQITVPAQDPCQKFPSCAYLASLNVNQMPCIDATPQNPNALPPGRYCNAVNGPATLAPTSDNTLYVFDQGFPSGSVYGSGVTIYNNSGGGITWNGNINVTVSAPTSGPASGMVYYQPPSNSGAILKNGQAGTVSFAGGFYAPSAAITMNGNLPSVSLFVAGSILMNGTGMNVAAVPGLVQSGHAVLVE